MPVAASHYNVNHHYAYVWRTLHGLRGDGRLEGKRVSTSRTNAKRRVTRSAHVYDLCAHQRGFEEVMVYYHIDEAIRYLERLGYRVVKGIFRKPLRVNVNGSREDNWTK